MDPPTPSQGGLLRAPLSAGLLRAFPAGGDTGSLNREQSGVLSSETDHPLPPPLPQEAGGSGREQRLALCWTELGAGGQGPWSCCGEGSSPGPDSAYPIWARAEEKGSVPRMAGGHGAKGSHRRKVPPAIGAQRQRAQTPAPAGTEHPGAEPPPALLVRAGRTGPASCGRPDGGQTGTEAAWSHQQGGVGAGIEARPCDVDAPQPRSKEGSSSSRPQRESPAWQAHTDRRLTWPLQTTTGMRPCPHTAPGRRSASAVLPSLT